MGVVGPPEKEKTDGERQEVTVNFVAHEGAVTVGDGLEGAVGKLWDFRVYAKCEAVDLRI